MNESVEVAASSNLARDDAEHGEQGQGGMDINFDVDDGPVDVDVDAKASPNKKMRSLCNSTVGCALVGALVIGVAIGFASGGASEAKTKKAELLQVQMQSAAPPSRSSKAPKAKNCGSLVGAMFIDSSNGWEWTVDSETTPGDLVPANSCYYEMSMKYVAPVLYGGEDHDLFLAGRMDGGKLHYQGPFTDYGTATVSGYIYLKKKGKAHYSFAKAMSRTSYSFVQIEEGYAEMTMN